MDNREIKKQNRKALPKFILIILLGGLVGGIFGYCSARLGIDSLADGVKAAGAFFGMHLAPWLLIGEAVLLPLICVPMYIGAKKMLSGWDGEDEELLEQIDHKLSTVLWVSSGAMILSWVFLAATYSGGVEMMENENLVFRLISGVVAFLVIFVETLLLQQKTVDAAKQTNPEKTASVYDTKFQKKWMDSCDEAEKIMIGKCAIKAFAATNTVCTVLAVVLGVSALVFNTGFLPSFGVCLIWFVNQSAYYKEAMRYSKSGIRIS